MTINKALTDFTNRLNKGEPVTAAVYMISMTEGDYKKFKRLAKTILLLKKCL